MEQVKASVVFLHFSLVTLAIVLPRKIISVPAFTPNGSYSSIWRSPLDFSDSFTQSSVGRTSNFGLPSSSSMSRRLNGQVRVFCY